MIKYYNRCNICNIECKKYIYCYNCDKLIKSYKFFLNLINRYHLEINIYNKNLLSIYIKTFNKINCD